MPDVSNESDHADKSSDNNAAPCQCESCRRGVGTPKPRQYVYAIGRIVPRFPSISIEREFQLIASDTDRRGRSDSQVFRDIVSAPENRYLCRKLCWVFLVLGLETFILVPRENHDVQLLLSTFADEHSSEKNDVLIGTKLGIAPEGMCGYLRLPIVVIDNIYSFLRKDFLDAIGPRAASEPDESAKASAQAVAEVLDRVLQSTDNAGLSAGDRALNFLAIRYPALYQTVAARFNSNFSLAEISTKVSHLGPPREIVEVIFTFRQRQTGFFEQVSIHVDVTEEFPFVVRQITPYIEH
jgi:hypothetical protein